MNSADMFFQASSSCKTGITNGTMKRLFSFMHSVNMFFQTSSTGKTGIASYTFERFLPLMNSRKMRIKATFLSKSLITLSTLKWLWGNSGMNSSNMFVQTTSSGKTSPANCTMERFFPLMNCVNMLVQTASSGETSVTNWTLKGQFSIR